MRSIAVRRRAHRQSRARHRDLATEYCREGMSPRRVACFHERGERRATERPISSSATTPAGGFCLSFPEERSRPARSLRTHRDYVSLLSDDEPVSVQLVRVTFLIVAGYGDRNILAAKEEDYRWSFAISAISWRSPMN